MVIFDIFKIQNLSQIYFISIFSQIIFFRFGNIHVAKRHAAHIEFKRFAKGI